ncbi:NADPH:quinone reductase-like Zn-dependent oxidoreductase [Bradyrhizobium liaoningense]
MKAVGYKKSLPIEDADSLIDFETAKPEPQGRDIRVAVKAISANPVDYKVRKRAAPPDGETKILGYDAAGVVDAVGPDVTLFKPGDEVFYAGSIDSGTTTPPRLGGRDERDSRVDLTTRGTLVPCIKTDIKTGMMPPPISGSR